MVQVDIFWSYGLSAGLALAGRKEIERSGSWWNNRAFLASVVWTSCVFAPAGMYLLWTNPGWETMFVAKDYSSLPAWLVAIFSLTNITQGIFGFYITAQLLLKKKLGAAKWQPIWSHLMMLAILVFGWDGTGYQRFFYAGSGTDWQAERAYSLSEFFSCPIFYALLGLSVFFIPSYLGLIAGLLRTKKS